MSDANRPLYLRIALIVFGLTFVFGVYVGNCLALRLDVGTRTLALSDDDVGVYATLGVFLLVASRNPDAHRSIIWFTVWSSLVHGGIMAFQSFNDAAERGHLVGDVPALFLIAIILGV